ncbi:MAG: alkaline phosphatase family protein, partial [Christensenellaceae bacterium]|nr:alkaline phosphatase family protein [Christensenellaceae bacterium]
CKAENITVSIFAIADGRDVPPQSIKKYIQQTTDFIKKIGVSAKIAVVGGRGQIFMDRYDTQTELLSRAISVCVDGKTAGNVHIGETAQNVDGETTTTAGRQKNPNDKTENAPTTDNVHIGETTQNRAYTNETTQNAPTTGDINKQIDEFYAANPTATDEQLPPFIVNSDGLIKNGDAVLFLNYRGDRAIETARMFDSGQYISPAQYEKIKDCFFVGVLQYDAENNLPKNYLCPPPDIKNTLTEWLCAKGIKQYTVTETVKFGHLTYFFNGNRTEPFDRDLENWCEIESDKLNNQYDKAPKMKAGEIADKLIFNLRHGDFDFYKCNFPNPDMVGHTGVFSAAVTACQFIDKQLGRLIEVCKNDRINLIITADHGNAEEMTDEKGNIKTSHTNNPVPFIVCPFGFCEDYDDILGKRRLKTVAAQNNANGDNAKLLDNGVKDDHAKFVGNGGKDDHAKLVGNGVKYPNIKLKDGEFGLTNIAATVCDLLGIVPNKVWNESIIKNAAQSYEKAKD